MTEPLYTTQYPDVTFQEGFNMHTGQPNPQSIINESISGEIVLYSTTKHYVFPALNVSNNFATIDYNAHIITKSDYTINHVFRSMTVQELNTLHIICELERSQLLKYFLCPFKSPNRQDFFSLERKVISFISKVSRLGYRNVLTSFHQYKRLIVALIESLYITKTH